MQLINPEFETASSDLEDYCVSILQSMSYSGRTVFSAIGMIRIRNLISWDLDK